jgi:prefoldin subunit 5
MKKYFWLTLFLLLAIAIMQISRPQQVVAQSDTALRSEVSSLRSRVSRLESEISSLRSSSRTTRTTPSSEPTQTDSPQVVNGVPVGSTDPLFQNLANLAIELKERVTQLEKRVAQLEK